MGLSKKKIKSFPFQTQGERVARGFPNTSSQVTYNETHYNSWTSWLHGAVKLSASAREEEQKSHALASNQGPLLKTWLKNKEAEIQKQCNLNKGKGDSVHSGGRQLVNI